MFPSNNLEKRGLRGRMHLTSSQSLNHLGLSRDQVETKWGAIKEGAASKSQQAPYFWRRAESGVGGEKAGGDPMEFN